MRIEWLGHATFKVINDDITIIFDPYADGFVPGLKNLREEANFVFSSHGHNDHNAVDLVNIIEKEANFKLTVLDSFHDDNNGNERGPNKIHILEFGDGIKLCHMGDIGCELTDSQYEALTGTDILLMPVGGFFTVDPVLASKICKKINPNVIIPMHFKRIGDKGFGYDVIADEKVFIEAYNEDSTYMGATYIDYDKDSKLSKIVVLEPKNL